MTDASEFTRRFGLAHPVVQGPFGGGLSSVELAATVSNLGGLGSFGAVNIPAAEIGPLVVRLSAATRAPFAVNLWVDDHDPGGLAIPSSAYEEAFGLLEPFFRELGVAKPEMPTRYHQPFNEQIDALLEAAPPVFSWVFGIPSPAILDACRRKGIATVGTATTPAEAEALDAAGVDAIVATGFEAGGHRVSFLRRAEDSLMGTFALTQLASRRVKAPVIAAGGIADGRGVRAALTLGASAAQVGTAFLACEESGASKAHREAIFSPAASDTHLTRVYTGRLARGIRNRFSDELGAVAHKLPPFPIQSWLAGHLKVAAAETQRDDLVSLWAGQIAPNLNHRRAADLMADLIAA